MTGQGKGQSQGRVKVRVKVRVKDRARGQGQPNHGQVVSECQPPGQRAQPEGPGPQGLHEWCESRGGPTAMTTAATAGTGSVQKALQQGPERASARGLPERVLDGGKSGKKDKADLRLEIFQGLHARERRTGCRTCRWATSARACTGHSFRVEIHVSGPLDSAARLGDGFCRRGSRRSSPPVPAARPPFPQRRARTREPDQRAPGTLDWQR